MHQKTYLLMIEEYEETDATFWCELAIKFKLL